MSESDIVQLARDGRVTLPNSLRRKAGLTAGSLLRAEVTEDGRIVLIPLVAVDRRQAFFWTSRWQAGERETEDNLRSGQVETFENIEDFIRDLQSGD